ncbi:endonuclease/exonuclease/phosphatase family protein [Streptomyces sp. NPDC005438]|uniref:endonuclease/exonuclease/phosphatase family protein n=1 Tax=Streptomyces sp. NPDC005438 TaxID=3156880 RepID=UPI0033AEF5CA
MVTDQAAGPTRGAARRRGGGWPVLCALTLLGLSALLGVRAADLDGPTPVPQLLAFLPWLLVPGWVALLFAVLSRRTLLALWAVVVLAFTGWYVQPYGDDARARDGEERARFRVLTANLGRGGATEELRRFLLREKPQVVAVQECERRCVRMLADSRVREVYPYRLVDTDGRTTAAGSALLSAFPLSDRGQVPATMAQPGATLEIGALTVRVQVVHPMPPMHDDVPRWERELTTLRKVAASRSAGTPTVFAGDFNSSQDHAVFRRLLDTGLRDSARLRGQSRTPTWPTHTAPPLGAQIDHVLVSRQLEPAEARFVDLAGSDHRALLVDLKLY